MGSGKRILYILTVLLILSGIHKADPGPTEGAKTPFLIKKWSTEDGLPQVTVTSMVQTQDGYLWVGTFGGLARFDGIRFTVFDSANIPNFTSNRILSLFEDSYGTLWIGAETGEVYTLRDLKLEEFRSTTDFDRKTVWGFEQDAAGDLFIASDSGLEKVAYDDRGTADPNSVSILSRELSYGLCKDPSGKIWVKLYRHYFTIKNGQLTPAVNDGLQLPDGILQMRFAGDGRAFAGAFGTLGVADSLGYREKLKLDGLHNGGFSLATQGSSLWFQQMEELVEITDSTVIHHDLKTYISGGSRAMLFDNEGNLWIATQFDGLIRLSRRQIGLVSDFTDQEIAGILTLAEDRDGSVWFGAKSLFRLNDGKITSFPQGNENSEFQVIRSIAIGPDGTLWAGGTLGLYRFQNGKMVSEPRLERTHIHALFFDKDGYLWIGSTEGIHRLKGDELKAFSTADGLVDDDVHFITQTKDDTIWIGTFQGISKYRDGLFENITVANGLPAGYVRDVLEDEDGTIWLATYGGGIVRLQGDKMVAIRRAEGLPNNFVSRILRDGDRFWILSNLGIFAVGRSELMSVADGTKDILIGSNYGTGDGMPSSEANGGHQYAGIKTRDGRLWFPMLKDIVFLDPKPTTSHPPRVAIESATSETRAEPQATSKLFDPTSILQVSDDRRNLQIDYTGLSFTKPEELRFFYRLDGLEEEWIDAGNRRTAFYPYLPAGDYTFQVKAVNSNGIWSSSPANLRVNVAQQFWETRIFMLLLLSTVIAAFIWWYVIRHRRQLEQQAAQQDFSRRLINAHELERQRMATDLHDGLGHNLLLIKNWALMANRKEVPSPERADYLKKISSTAANSIEETRTIVQNLSPQNLGIFGLTDAILNIISDFQDATGLIFDANIENIDKVLPDEAEISVYRIVQEGLNNIVKHSGSSRGRIEILHQPGAVSIVMEDFGRGFEGGIPAADTGKSEGVGLLSISERVRLIGGELTIESAQNRGTKITIKIDV